MATRLEVQLTIGALCYAGAAVGIILILASLYFDLYLFMKISFLSSGIALLLFSALSIRGLRGLKWG